MGIADEADSSLVKYGQLGVAVALPFVGGMLSGRSMKDWKGWYEDLKKAPWTPPSWVFGPVWSFLYTSMGTASYLVYRDGGGFSGPAGFPLAVYGGHLLLNFSWTPIFFGARQYKLGMAVLLGICGSVGYLAHAFGVINPTAGKLMLPYLAWGLYASTLNGYVVLNNGDCGAEKNQE